MRIHKIERFRERFQTVKDKRIRESDNFKFLVQADGKKRNISVNAPKRHALLRFISDTTASNACGVTKEDMLSELAKHDLTNMWLYNNSDYVYLSKKTGCYKLTKLGASALNLYNNYSTFKSELIDNIRDEIMNDYNITNNNRMLSREAREEGYSEPKLFEGLTDSNRHLYKKAQLLIENLWFDETKERSASEREEKRRDRYISVRERRANRSRNRRVNEELSELQKKYQQHFLDKLKEFDAESPADLSDEEKSEFFESIKKTWIKGEGPKGE